MVTYYQKMKKYIVLLLAVMAVSFVSVSCSSDDDVDYSQEYNRTNKEKGELFLALNRDSAGVKETYTGLQYRVETLGKGIRPDANDSVYISYVAMLVDGTVFESGKYGFEMENLIAGMREGLQLMPEGSVFHLYIPYYLAYNTASKQTIFNGKIVSVSAYSALHYYIKLNKVTSISEAPEI